ncbi:MAG: hypothetical protein COA91_07325 [Robiginitomaculum sp.]|nr:MAG: hypothetical protein COA91_07325 [Robiginitomaculum sp.]
MKLDLIAIEKLCPRSLYPLRDLQALISILARVISLNIGSIREARTYAHMLMQNTKILRKHQQHNLN